MLLGEVGRNGRIYRSGRSHNMLGQEDQRR